MFVGIKNDNSSLVPWEYMKASEGEYKSGQMLKVVDGLLAEIDAATATTPPYICMADKSVEEGGEIAVTRVSKTVIYETTLSAAAATAAVGGKLQVSAGGLNVMTGAGTFEIVSLEGTAVDDVVRGRFV